MESTNDTELKIEVVLHRSPSDMAQLRAQLPSLQASVAAAAEMAAGEALKLYQAEKSRMVEYFLQGAVLQPLDVRKARMKADAMRDIFAGTEWLTAEQVGTASLDLSGAAITAEAVKAGAARANRWKNEKKIFALQRDGRDWYSRYQFDATFTPIPMMKTIVGMFGDVPRIEIASWMESPNNYLDGKRPREVLENAPDAIWEALMRHFEPAARTSVMRA
jgi:hypothetical protein